ncbi:acyltransferase [Lacihabitans sp. CS3-21]|uniref:acyltransferase family protein n=1 Tax=Lacihabitans sp. CS3-21 TaxID=2487332 RepID=UPI0020CBCDA2|nr:acyltransferase [Lacihabitans sp. CS3-21]MCP9747285.1 acyltransferase [Lacihabitans sp. CS3-21]
MPDYKNIKHFEGLNALRFFAAFLVVIHHAEAVRKKNGLFNLDWLSFFKNGGNAVTFFFVLSGFLITYLLLKEDNQTGETSIKTFYLKRTLRIWPLYFLMFFVGALVLPIAFKFLHIGYEMPYTFSQVWYYFVFFFPGLVTFYFGHHILEPLWSIGVEEVFYLIWAPLFKIFKKYILQLLLGVILTKMVIDLVSIYIYKDELFRYISSILSFDAMAVGGLGAYLVFNRKKDFTNLFIYKPLIQILIYTLLAVFLIYNINFQNQLWKTFFSRPVFSKLFLDFLFLYIIIGVSLIPQNLFKIKSKFLSYLGEISYGIYMYHMFVIYAIVLVLKPFLSLMAPLFSTVVFYSILFLLVFLVSYLSKKYFEDYFLKIKARLEKR